MMKLLSNAVLESIPWESLNISHSLCAINSHVAYHGIQPIQGTLHMISVTMVGDCAAFDGLSFE